MEHLTQQQESSLGRLGFHYFESSDRYSLADAKQWINNLKTLEANWLVLINPPGRAIPEDFIRYARKKNVNLIIDFQKSIGSFDDFSEISTFLEVYGKWGIRYACLFKHPNLRSSWGDSEWISKDIVRTHTDLFLEFARLCVENHIQPVFSPLHPEGDYWDLAFLENSLRMMQKNTDISTLEKVIISAYGWHYHHPLDWGTGGKARWPKSSFFSSSDNDQNHHGFRLYEWYSELSKSILGIQLPVIIFEAGKSGADFDGNDLRQVDWTQNLNAVIKLLSGENVFNHDEPDHLFAHIGLEVIACCIYNLASNTKNGTPYSWFTPDGSPLPLAERVQNHSNKKSGKNKSPDSHPLMEINYPYARYLFIDQPLQPNVPDLLEKLDPYIKKHRPFIGFSLLEGIKAAYLIVVTDNKEEFLQKNKGLLEDANLVKIVSLMSLHALIGDHVENDEE